MTFTAMAADPRRGGSAGFTGGKSPDVMAPSLGDGRLRPDFGFALRPGGRSPAGGVGEEMELDRLVEGLHRHSHDAEALRRASGAIRHTVETSLLQSLQSGNSRLPLILSEAAGAAGGLFLAGQLHRFVKGLREWFVILSSPRRWLWAIKAVWDGDEIAERVSERAAWHSVDQVAVFERECRAPLVRVGVGTATDEEDWLASNPVFAVTERHLSGDQAPEEAQALPSAHEGPWAHTMVVVGERAEIEARITGHPPPQLKCDLQSLCRAADEILADPETGRAGRVLRLKQLITPALKKNEPDAARHFWRPAVILGVFLAAGALLMAAAGVEHLRWESMVKQVDAEPGIEVISHSAAWGRRQIDLLRDPQARQVSVVLLEQGLGPASVSVHERSFVSPETALSGVRKQEESLDPPVSRENQSGASPKSGEWRGAVVDEMRLDLLRSLLDLPDGIELKLTSGDLSVRGSLAEPAYSRLADSPKRFSWIKKLHLEQVRDVTTETIAGFVRELEDVKVEFLLASAVLPEASKLRLRSIATQMKQLAGQVRLKQQKVRLQFCAAHPGLEDGIVALRTEAVRRDLVRMEVPEAWFDMGAGALDATGPQTVSLRIHIESQATAP